MVKITQPQILQVAYQKDSQATSIVSSCYSCQRNKVTNQTCFSRVQNYLPEETNEILSIDFYSPLTSSKAEFKYILSTIDAFSKFIVLYPLRKVNAEDHRLTTLKKGDTVLVNAINVSDPKRKILKICLQSYE